MPELPKLTKKEREVMRVPLLCRGEWEAIKDHFPDKIITGKVIPNVEYWTEGDIAYAQPMNVWQSRELNDPSYERRVTRYEVGIFLRKSNGRTDYKTPTAIAFENAPVTLARVKDALRDKGYVLMEDIASMHKEGQ